MPDAAATSIYTKPLDRLARLLAATPTFQAITMSADEATALKRVHIPLAVDGQDHDAYPRAVIQWGPSAARVQIATGVFRWENPTAYMLIEAEIADIASYDESAEHRWFLNQVGNIVEEMEKLSGTGESVPGETHLFVTNISMLDEGPGKEYPEEQEQHRVETLRKPTWWINHSVEWF